MFRILKMPDMMQSCDDQLVSNFPQCRVTWDERHSEGVLRAELAVKLSVGHHLVYVN